MSVRAHVQMTVEIAIRDHWSPETTAAQIQSQAVAAAEDALRRGLAIRGLVIREGATSPHPVPASIVGSPIVTMVIARSTGTGPSEGDDRG